MIPEKLRLLVERQRGDWRRVNQQAVERELDCLGVAPTSEFGQFFSQYKASSFRCKAGHPELLDIAEPSPQVAHATEFVQQVWNLPSEYVCFSSVEGEGGFLYNKNTGEIWDFSLAQSGDFLSSEQQPHSRSFFDFMRWYLE